MEAVIVAARERRLDSLMLHSADEARSLYEQMGSVATNEMRFGEDLAT